MKKKWLVICCLSFLILLVVGYLYFYQQENATLESSLEYIEEPVTFSYDTGVYHEAIDISIDLSSSLNGGMIYYTLNGDDPDNTSTQYTDSIHLTLKSDTAFYPLKAVIYKDGEYSEIYEKTYVLDKSTSNYDLPIVSLTCDNDSLYDEESGIFTYENVYNTGDEWIKQAHVTMFDYDGSVVLDQGVGIALAGGTSVEFDIKSLKLYAGDYTYDPDYDHLDIPYFNDQKEDISNYSYVEEYKSIRLRAGSQDQLYGNIRSSLVSDLAQESNFDGYMDSQRILVMLNGEIYGVFDMETNYSNSYLKNKFGLDSATRVKGSETQCFGYYGITEYFENDLTVESNRELLEKYVDMDNYLTYYAINILINNTDWPDNNYSIWKYDGTTEDPNNKYTDGRVRFLLFDDDLTYYTYGNTSFFDGSISDNFVNNMEGWYLAINATSFRNVMASDYYRDKFLNIILDLLNTSFDEENIYEIIDDEYALVDQPMKDTGIKAYQNSDYYIELMKTAVSERRQKLMNDFYYYWGFNATYHASIKLGYGLTVTWNNMTLDSKDSYENDYFVGTDLTYTVTEYPGYTFDYWLVNGKKIYTKELTITGEYYGEEYEIEAVSHASEEGVLVIEEFSAKDDNDFYILANNGLGSIDLSDYYLTDTLKDLHQYQLPDVVLNQNETILINGKNNKYEIGDYISNFKLNSEEILYLTDGTNIIDQVKVPNMTKDETYGRYLSGNRFVYYKNENQERRATTY